MNPPPPEPAPTQPAVGPGTTAVHAGVARDRQYGSVTTPIYPSSTYRFDEVSRKPAFDYGRSGHPNRAALEEALAALEGGAGAVATATGMAAVTTVLALLRSGDHVVYPHDVYGGTWRLFQDVFTRWGLHFTAADLTMPGALAAALRPETRLVWIETPSNPLLALTDLAPTIAQAHAAGALALVDNTFLSPLGQRPMDFGADLVLESTTKYLNGHSDVVGGAVVARTAEHAAQLRGLVNTLGTGAAPFDTWLVRRGLKTLEVRLAAHERNAGTVARFLAAHPRVARVRWPGLADHPQHALAARQQRLFGGMVTFETHPGAIDFGRFFAALRTFTLAESLGGVESLAEMPFYMTQASMPPDVRRAKGVTENMVRLSVGIENEADLVDDLSQALDAGTR